MTDEEFHAALRERDQISRTLDEKELMLDPLRRRLAKLNSDIGAHYRRLARGERSGSSPQQVNNDGI